MNFPKRGGGNLKIVNLPGADSIAKLFGRVTIRYVPGLTRKELCKHNVRSLHTSESTFDNHNPGKINYTTQD